MPAVKRKRAPQHVWQHFIASGIRAKCPACGHRVAAGESIPKSTEIPCVIKGGPEDRRRHVEIEDPKNH